MRTTVTLDPDTEALVKRAMAERGLTFKEALNRAIRAGAAPASAGFRSPTFDLGAAKVPLGHALRLAGALEDEELSRKLSTRN